MKNLFIIILTFNFHAATAQDLHVMWGFAMGQEYGGVYDRILYSAVDSENNFFTLGIYTGLYDVDPSPESTDGYLAIGDPDIFLVKHSPDGELIWFLRITAGPDKSADVRDIHIDEYDNIYLTGSLGASYFLNESEAPFILGSPSNSYIFKFNSNGDLLWANGINAAADPAPSSQVYSTGITTNESGNIYLTGRFEGTVDFDNGDGVHLETSTDFWDNNFIAKYDQMGNFLWVKIFDGQINYGRNILTDSMSNIYFAGRFSGLYTDFAPGDETYLMESEGSQDICFSKLDSSGNHLWSKRAGSYEWDEAVDFTIDKENNVYITGFFEADEIDLNTNDGESEIFDVSYYQDAFIIKVNSDGEYQWGGLLGPSDDEFQFMAYNSSNNSIYLAGSFVNIIDVDPGEEEVIHSGLGGLDFYIIELDNNRNVINAHVIGGAGNERFKSLNCDNNGDVLMTGTIVDTVDLYPGTGEFIIDDHEGDIQVKYSKSALSLVENTLNSAIKIYPNPCDDVCTIHCLFEPKSGLEYKVISLDGKTVLTGQLLGQSNIINLTQLIKGTYIIKITGENIFYTSRILKR